MKSRLCRGEKSNIENFNALSLTGYSAPLDFKTAAGGCLKSSLLETSQFAKPVAVLQLLRRTRQVLPLPYALRQKLKPP